MVKALAPLSLTVLCFVHVSCGSVVGRGPYAGMPYESNIKRTWRPLMAARAVPTLRFFFFSTYTSAASAYGAHMSRRTWWRVVHEGGDRRVEEIARATGDRMMRFLKDEADFDDACRIHGAHLLHPPLPQVLNIQHSMLIEILALQSSFLHEFHAVRA